MRPSTPSSSWTRSRLRRPVPASKGHDFRSRREGEDGHSPRDLAKIAVERHLATGRIGLGFVRGFGLERGAMAPTIAHDAHNIVVVGVDDGDMARAVQRLAELGGGLCVIADRGVQAELALPVAGLVSDAPLAEVVEASRACVAAAEALGCTFLAPFQTTSFLALSVIPKLKITDRGLIDVERLSSYHWSAEAEVTPLRRPEARIILGRMPIWQLRPRRALHCAESGAADSDSTH